MFENLIFNFLSKRYIPVQIKSEKIAVPPFFPDGVDLIDLVWTQQYYFFHSSGQAYVTVPGPSVARSEGNIRLSGVIYEDISGFRSLRNAARQQYYIYICFSEKMCISYT